jgi:hypothetical protein
MMQNSELRFHAKKITTTIGNIIKFLSSSEVDTNDEVDLVTLGKRHIVLF